MTTKNFKELRDQIMSDPERATRLIAAETEIMTAYNESQHKAVISERRPNPEYWSDMQISCICGWKSNKISYAEQTVDYKAHKKEV